MAKSETKVETVPKAKYDKLLAEHEKLQGEFADQGEKLKTVSQSHAQLEKSIRGFKAAATKAKNEATALKASDKPRIFEPIEDPLSTDELVELLHSSDEPFELVFLNGSREVRGLAPRSIPGSAFRRTSRGVRLDVPSIEVKGPAGDKPPYRINGYALLFGEGDLVAVRARGDAITIGAGQTAELAEDVIF